MKTITSSFAFLSFLLIISTQLVAQSGVSSINDVVINEVDTDNPGSDNSEFIELYGPASLPLDGLVLVFYNGLSDNTYSSFDLDGYSLSSNGFFVIGSAAVPNVGLVMANNILQNGPDAVALYVGNASDFPNNTPLTSANLVDALVYGTDDPDDDGLLTLLNPGQPQANESANGNAAAQSMARIPDGGVALNTDTYIAQAPTPGATNILACAGGTIQTTEALTTVEVCIDFDEAFVEFVTTTEPSEADYIWVITTTADAIIAISNTPDYDFAGSDEGMCRVWGVSILGDLNPASIEVGDPVTGILASGCVELSENFIEVSKLDCIPPICDGGEVSADGQQASIVLCVNNDLTTITFSNGSVTPDASYVYIVTTDNNVIIDTFTNAEYDFAGFDPEDCRVYGLSYTGLLQANTIEPGDLISGVIASECSSLSENFILIEKVQCVQGEGCTDLFFSEYIEGTSQNKALEIYNPTPFPINMSGYIVQTYNDGAVVPVNSLALSGIIGPEETYVIVNSQAMPAMLALADITSNVTFFNGNDAIALRKNGIAIDIIGIIGQDPGKANPWTVGDGSGTLAEYTVVRNPAVTDGETNWSIAQTGWDAYPLNTVTFLGNHQIVPCNYPDTPSIGFTTSTINVLEGNTVNVNLNILFPITAVEAAVEWTGGTATPGVDFIDVTPVTVNFPEAGFANQSFSFTTIDDSELEGVETIVLEVSAVTPAEILIGILTINILANDQGIPLYDIVDVRGVDVNGVADSLGVHCELRGIVHGLNTNPAGLQFTLIDETQGIGVFSLDQSFDYIVTEGDSVHVVGTIEQFNGLTQIVPELVYLVDGGHPLNQPVLVAQLNENTESEMIQLKCFELVDPTQWTNQSPGFAVEVSNGALTFSLYIDEDTDIFGTDAPEGVFTTSGIGSQFDTSSPFTGGYQLRPRYLADFSVPVSALFSPSSNAIEGVPVVFTNESEGASSYSWNFGDGSSNTEENTSHVYENEGSYTVTLTAFSLDGACSDQYSFVVVVGPNSVFEIGETIGALYPNPASNSLTIDLKQQADNVKIIDATGRVVLELNTKGQMKVVVDISTLAQGTYFVMANQQAMRFVKG